MSRAQVIDRVRTAIKEAIEVQRVQGVQVCRVLASYNSDIKKCCVLGAVAGPMSDYERKAADKLGITLDDAESIEAGFMEWPGLLGDMYDLGKEFLDNLEDKSKYCGLTGNKFPD